MSFSNHLDFVLVLGFCMGVQAGLGKLFVARNAQVGIPSPLLLVVHFNVGQIFVVFRKIAWRFRFRFFLGRRRL